jgi:carbon monoxide dehydrogenase subunit G
MTVSVDLDVHHEFRVKAPFTKVFAVLADVPTSASHFPQVHALVALGGGAYRWEMERIGTRRIHIQTVYACTYRHDRAGGSVTWEPVPGVGNASISGSWKISRSKPGTRVVLRTHGVIDVALPALMKPVVAPLARSEFERLVATYVANLTARFGGPA